MKWRWVALVLLCLTQSAAFFCYDYPSVLHLKIINHYNIKEETYSYLYSFYSLPNMVLPIFLGLILGKIGD